MLCTQVHWFVPLCLETDYIAILDGEREHGKHGFKSFWLKIWLMTTDRPLKEAYKVCKSNKSIEKTLEDRGK